MSKFKVVTRIVQYIEADSREDAERYQLELVKQGKLTLERDAETTARISRIRDTEYLQAPEDISQTRDPVEQPRPQDWVEIEQFGMSTVALVNRLSKRRIYYIDGLTKEERSLHRDDWATLVRGQKIHPRYEKTLPPFLIGEAITEHDKKGLLKGVAAQPESSVLLAVLERFGYIPDDYEITHGYWAENELDRKVSEYILERSPKPEKKADDADDEEFVMDIFGSDDDLTLGSL